MLKTLLTLTLAIGVTSPVLAQVGPGLGSSDYARRRNTTRYGRICTRNYDGRLSMRSGPSQNFRKLAEIPNYRNVPLHSGKYSNDGFWWWRTDYNGYGGWVRADYVCEDPQ